MQHFGRIDTLINNAGIFIPKPFVDYSLHPPQADPNKPFGRGQLARAVFSALVHHSKSSIVCSATVSSSVRCGVMSCP